ncbi:undecaprenyl-diphosphate phosphatase [Indioceanicola profundi]|uniref:undecaprenyl-diphosphate phosphatase n=1 Tax=Indioceanicola profundi TaxID=2220096 RepID=UPI000E6AB596|nr:undecaprenyl-diphosphate phosphatase [Indioceanicola profundi]
MDAASQYLNAVILGVLEGLTEFIPVSSTGHLILLANLLGFEGQAEDVFKVVIQLGAVLAVLIVYFGKLWKVLVGLPFDNGARRFAAAVILAFLPAAALGATLHGFIKGVLFNPVIVCVALVVGGILILIAERAVPQPRHYYVEEFPVGLSLRIGLFQCLALIPGVSRSGASIIGALMMGVDRRAAAEFSFFVAIPTMLGAATYDIYKNRDVLTFDGVGMIAVGFAVAFLSALLVVKSLVAFVGKYGFTPFAWYRIALGTLGLAFFLL